MTDPARNLEPRRGLVSVTMLIGLIILGLVAASLLKVAIARRSAAKSEENQRQAELLIDSAVARAAARLDANPDYAGDVWEIAAEELVGRGSARITTQVKPDPALPGGRSLVLNLEYLASTPHPVRLSRTIRLPLPSTAR